MHNPKSRAFPKDRSSNIVQKDYSKQNYSTLEKAIAVSGVTLGSAVE